MSVLTFKTAVILDILWQELLDYCCLNTFEDLPNIFWYIRIQQHSYISTDSNQFTLKILSKVQKLEFIQQDLM